MDEIYLCTLLILGFLTFVVCEIGKILNEINYKLDRKFKGGE